MAKIIDKPINVLKLFRANVLDDDSETNNILRNVFKTYGLINIHFYEETDPFLKETDENVHLCFLDWKLKDPVWEWNGLHVAKLLRSKFKRKLKIVFVTSHTEKRFMQELINIHIDGFVNKDDADYMDQMVNISKDLIEEIRGNLEYAVFLENEIK